MSLFLTSFKFPHPPLSAQQTFYPTALPRGTPAGPFDLPKQPRSAGFSVVETTGGREEGNEPRAQGLAWGLVDLVSTDSSTFYENVYVFDQNDPS